ncbi:tumor necrosis factor receptor superfamily member 27 isoform X3 [Nannospalax galili]|uniref:tumor necrosis factor receptor superfamily member 27 isoform X3 n=1 Tax=Nannospalax galili TaxID=1026970 RepID=UPI00111C12B9|nr:tumor necrosis factor receptor superfamily member 27 isoform X3 [Nannospalax galili]
MNCQENEYWDQWGRCATCQQCGPGQELSKDCGYGEGGDAYCTACPPRRYKSSWGHHRCQTCITCAVINRIQKTNCTATSNAICGDCLPRCLPVELSEDRCTCSAPSGGHTCCTGSSLQYEVDKVVEEDSLFPMPPGQETSLEFPVSEIVFDTQPLNCILDDDCSSTRGFPTQESFTMASCASESPSQWVHSPIECTELDLQKFSSSASSTGVESLRSDTAENSEDKLEFSVPFEVPSP